MKKFFTIALLGFAVVGFGFRPITPVAPKQTFYFFCMSREVPLQEAPPRQLQLVYTDILEFTGQASGLSNYTKQFADYISQQCRPGNEVCTSDLNSYPSREEAQKRYNEYLTKYGQGKKYQLARIDFQFK